MRFGKYHRVPPSTLAQCESGLYEFDFFHPLLLLPRLPQLATFTGVEADACMAFDTPSLLWPSSNCSLCACLQHGPSVPLVYLYHSVFRFSRSLLMSPHPSLLPSLLGPVFVSRGSWFFFLILCSHGPKQLDWTYEGNQGDSLSSVPLPFPMNPCILFFARITDLPWLPTIERNRIWQFLSSHFFLCDALFLGLRITPLHCLFDLICIISP